MKVRNYKGPDVKEYNNTTWVAVVVVVVFCFLFCFFLFCFLILNSLLGYSLTLFRLDFLGLLDSWGGHTHNNFW